MTLSGCRGARFDDEALGDRWIPAPGGRHGIQIVENPRRGIQEIWHRFRFRDDHDEAIDALHSAGSLVWSSSGKWLVVNHRDYPYLHDFVIFQLARRQMVERPAMTQRVQALWDRLHPEPMASLSFQGHRWSRRGNRLLVFAFGQPEADSSQLIREALWIDPEEGIVRMAEEIPAALFEQPSPFGD